jgi:GMP synthase (glutamine-hydrolysing)
MILIIDCTNPDLPLLRYEFIDPLVSIIEKAGFQSGIRPLSDQSPPGLTEGIILSGTALRDQEFLKTGLPCWFSEWKGPVLGICAGMQLLAVASGGSLVQGEEIGMNEIPVIGSDPLFSGTERFSAWELHQSGVVISTSCQVLALTSTGVKAFRRRDRPWYGVLFHPEVRNEWIIHNFLRICSLMEHPDQEREE